MEVGLRNLERVRATRLLGRSLAGLVLLLSSVAFAEGGLILFPSLGTTRQVTVGGRVLREAPTDGSSVWSQNLRNLTASTWEGAQVEVAYDGQKQTVTSGEAGAFEVTFTAQKDHPFSVGRSSFEARISDATGKAAVTVLADDAPFIVISDFDDTIAETNVLSKKKLLANALLKNGETQPVVKGMPEWYRCMVSDPKVKPGFAVVSGSPIQFNSRVTAFLAKNDFPVGGLYLRNLGPKTLSNYKQPVIRSILQRVPLNAVLIGDSGEHDPEVYKQIREEFPGRVLAIYIHDVGNSADASRFKDMVLFKDPKDGAADAVKKGYLSEACFQKAFDK